MLLLTPAEPQYPGLERPGPYKVTQKHTRRHLQGAINTVSRPGASMSIQGETKTTPDWNIFVPNGTKQTTL